MESSIFRQIAELAREHKTAARATAVFLCLALVVTAATVGILTYTGHAMTQKVKVLTCPLVVHEHTPECRDAEGNLVCGYADYVVHIHNDDCFDEDGALVCSLPEVYPHTHDDSCYGEVKTLICGQEEAKGHEHTDACYDRQRGELTCTETEHTHGADCYIREEVLTCTLTEQEHIHTDVCYATTRDLTCGQEEGVEHTHSDACYTETRTLICDKTTEPHVHGPECYTVNETLVCQIPEYTHTDDCYAWTETLICEIPEGQIPEGGHVHSDECYEITEDLICGKLEKHEHTDACFVLDENGNRTGQPICGQIELLEHVHGEDCFTVVEQTTGDGSGLFFVELFETDNLELICGKTAHTHDESCLDENGQLVCGLEEHTHDDSCYSAPLTAETPEDAETAETSEDAPAEEAAPAYLCGKEEHTHDDTCLDENGELVCGKEEHVHDDTCLPLSAETYETLCGKEEHRHSDACLDENGQIVCGLEEHIHNASCLALPESVFVKTWKDAGTMITARYTAEAQLPEDATLQAYRVTPENYPARYEDRVESALDALGEGAGSGATMLVYNIGFYTADGKEVEPLAPVTITIQFLDENGLPVGSPVKVVHFGKDGVQTMEGSTVDGSSSTSFVTDSFSDFSFFLPPFLDDIAVIGEPRRIANGSNDLAGFIVDSWLKHGDVEVGDGGEIELGEKYTYHVKFQESSDKQFDKTMTFQLPDDFIVSPVKDMEVKSEDGKVVGKYSINENGLVTFEFTDESFLAEGNGWVDLDLTITAVNKNGDTEAELPWTGGEDLTYHLNGNTKYGMVKEPASDNWNPVDHTIEYTVTLEVTEGALFNPVITDEMEDGVHILCDESENPIDYTITVMDGDNDITGTLNPKPSLRKTDTGWVVDNLPDPLTKGQKVLINYKAEVDPEVVPDEEKGETQLNFNVDNKATLTGSLPGEKPIDELTTDDVKVHVTDDWLTKEGSTVAGNDELIDWEICVGTGSRDVRGTTLTDTMKEDLYVDTEHTLDIKWKEYPDDTIKTKELKWTFDEKGELTGEITKYVKNVQKTADGRITSFEVTIPGEADSFWVGTSKDPSRNWENGDWVKVEYYTKYVPDPSGDPKTYTNHVEGWKEVLPDGIDGTIVVGEGSIFKQIRGGERVEGTDETPGYFPYQVTVKVPSWEALVDAGATVDDDPNNKYPRFYIEDELEFPVDSNAPNKDTRRYFVQNAPQIESIEAVRTNGTVYKFVDVTKDPNADYTYCLVDGGGNNADGRAARTFHIYFNTHIRGKGRDPKVKSMTAYSEWTLDEATTLVINYRIPDNAGLVIDNGDRTYTQTDLTVKDLLEQGRMLENVAMFKTGDDGPGSSSNVKYNESFTEPGLLKQASLQEDGLTVNYTVIFRNSYKEGDEEFTICTFEDPEKVVFQDVYDNRLEYVPGSLKVSVNDVGNNMRGIYSISDEKNIQFVENKEDGTTTLKVSPGAFDVLGEHTNYIHDMKSLEAWMKAYQSTSSKELKDSNYVFTYQLRIKDSARKPEEMTLDNTAHLIFDDQDLSDHEDVRVQPDVLDKTGEIVENSGQKTSQVDYSIHVNHGAANMAYRYTEEGKYLEIDAYLLEDVMSDGLILEDWTTVKVEGRAAGTEAFVPYERVASKDLVGKGTQTFTLEPLEGQNGFQLYLPDEVEFRITYTARVTAAQGHEADVSNKVILHGYTDTSEELPTKFTVQTVGSTAGAGSSVRLIKRSEGDSSGSGKILAGAKFDLYAQVTGSGDAPVQADGQNLYRTGSIESSDKYDTSSGQYGTVITANEGAPADGLYVLVETDAPEGYNLVEKPIVFTFAEKPGDGPKYVQVTVNDITYDSVEVQYVGRNNSRLTLDVEDPPAAFTLPDSGGPGNSELYILGGALILASLTLYYTRPRKKESEG